MDDFGWDDDPLASFPWIEGPPVDNGEQLQNAGGLAPKRRRRPQAEVRELGTPIDKPLSDGCLEIELLRGRAYSISWEPSLAVPPKNPRGALTSEQRSLIEALYELRLLSAGQIHREFLTSISLRQLRRELSRLRADGILRRGWLEVRMRGRAKPIYMLGRDGFALLRDSPDHPASGEWRKAVPGSAAHAVHDLARNQWLFAFGSLAPNQLLGFRGPRSGRIVSEGFSSILPDLTLEVRLEKPDGKELRTDLLTEIEMHNNNETVRRKVLAYDALLNDGWREHPRYQAQGQPPIVVLVVPDLARARRYISLLDETLQGHVVIAPHTRTRTEHEQGLVPRAKKLYVGRQNVLVAVARDIHQRALRTCRVPAEPPDERVLKARSDSERSELSRPTARRIRLIDPRDLIDPAV